MHFCPVLGKGWSPPTCLHCVFFLLNSKTFDSKVNKLKANELAYLWPTRQHNLLAGPKILPISPFGRATNRDFRERTRLWPLYTTLWCWPGRDMGLIVPSTNPKQVSRGAPFAWITAAYSCNIAGQYLNIKIPSWNSMIMGEKNKIHHCVCNHAYFGCWSCKTMNHV